MGNKHTTFYKKNGFPTQYGYTCGYVTWQVGKRDHVYISEDSSHNVLDVKGFMGTQRIWEQFFYSKYATKSACAREAEKCYKKWKAKITQQDSVFDADLTECPVCGKDDALMYPFEH